MTYALERRLFGMTYGNFLLLSEKRSSRLIAVAQLRSSVPHNLGWMYAPRLNFTNEVAELDRSHGIERLPREKFAWTHCSADGMVLAEPMTAVVILNADCPTVTLWQEDTIAHLLCGFRNLVCEKPNTPSIIEVAVQKFFNRTHVHAMIGHGIGPCCWSPGYKDHGEIWQPQLAPNHAGLLGECIGCTTRGPFGNMQRTVDLYKLARLLLLHAGVLEEHIEWDTTCTCCALFQGRPLYWSQMRYQKQIVGGGVMVPGVGRNASLAWLDHERSAYQLM